MLLKYATFSYMWEECCLMRYLVNPLAELISFFSGVRNVPAPCPVRIFSE